MKWIEFHRRITTDKKSRCKQRESENYGIHLYICMYSLVTNSTFAAQISKQTLDIAG